jgi:hypothetical protein
MLPKGGSVTQASIQEYADAIRQRYKAGHKAEKGKILDEFTKVTGMHRKSAIRLLQYTFPTKLKQKRGRNKYYGNEVTSVLRKIWEASDRLCSKRLQPFIPEMIKVFRQHGEQQINITLESQLCQISPATIDRLLKPWRRLGGRRGLTTTKPGSLLKNTIPIRTFTEWQENKPGFLEMDLVAHCGESADGFYMNTLTAVDVASRWTECAVVWGKGRIRVGGAVHRIKERLPFLMLGLDSDNGGEFINRHLYDYCRRWNIKFTRSRSYKKNDSCYVEQKNWNMVRRVVGYDRYTSKSAYDCLDRVYSLLRLYMNFFQPTMKLLAKSRHGAKVHKVYDIAQTPYQRLLKLCILSASKQAELAAVYYGLNPVVLLKQINENLERLWKLADHRDSLYSERALEKVIR